MTNSENNQPAFIVQIQDAVKSDLLRGLHSLHNVKLANAFSMASGQIIAVGTDRFHINTPIYSVHTIIWQADKAPYFIRGYYDLDLDQALELVGGA